ncbi:MAG: FMN-binding negative transcriptional regulator [Candidatus Eremiobacteraeota bacterium]|nr:FMN-binding negative transcriptional regulator [Candidatus Eremiobacteraeota bacterium]
MYVPHAFRPTDARDALTLIERHPFANVVSVVAAKVVVSSLPCAIIAREPALVIGAHFARANPHWKAIESAGATLLFEGPHGYISPRWYTAPYRDVPTWNYAAVHVTATAKLLDEPETRALLERLTAEFEGNAADGWSMYQAEEDFIAAQLRGIVGVHFIATTVDAKFKLSQNRAPEDRDGATRGLRSSGREADRELAELMDYMSKPPLTV